MSATLERRIDEAFIEGLCAWGKPKRVETKRGPRDLRKAQPTEQFHAAWSEHRLELKDLGVSWSRDRNDQWELCWWQKPEGADEIVAKREASKAASSAVSADLEVPCPPGLSYLPFQRAGIAYALARTNTLFGDEMGLGKTVQAIGVVNALPEVRKVLVVCPASLKLNWRNELKRWLARPLTVEVGDSKRWPQADVGIINYDILRKRGDLDATEYDLLVLDEAHFIKGKSQRSKAALSIRAKRKLFLTGTPIVNKPVELWNLVHALDPVTFSNFWSFAKKYCDGFNNGFGWDFSGSKNLGELHDKLRGSVMVRRLKKDVLTELPAKRRQVVEIEGGAAIVARERDAWEAQEERVNALRVNAELAKASDDPAEYAMAIENLRAGLRLAFTEIAKARHDTAVAKIPFVIEHLHDALDEDESAKLIVFAHHHDVLNAIAEEFCDRCVLLTGETPVPKRQGLVERFQTDPSVQLFVGSLTAAGTGLTLTASAHVVFAELDWVPGNVTQAEDRAHRIGQAQSVLVQHLVLQDSLDAKMARTLVAKQSVIEQALDKGEAEQPVTPGSEQAASAGKGREKVAALAETLTAKQIPAIHRLLRILAGLCDGAHSLDGSGFSKLDVGIGHRLAEQPYLTPKQAALGLLIARKYRRQLPPDLLATALGDEAERADEPYSPRAGDRFEKDGKIACVKRVSAGRK